MEQSNKYAKFGVTEQHVWRIGGVVLVTSFNLIFEQVYLFLMLVVVYICILKKLDNQCFDIRIKKITQINLLIVRKTLRNEMF